MIIFYVILFPYGANFLKYAIFFPPYKISLWFLENATGTSSWANSLCQRVRIFPEHYALGTPEHNRTHFKLTLRLYSKTPHFSLSDSLTETEYDISPRCQQGTTFFYIKLSPPLALSSPLGNLYISLSMLFCIMFSGIKRETWNH